MAEDPRESKDEQTEPLKTTQTWQSSELFGDAKLIRIDHGGETYQLRITRQGKLILNK